MRRAGRPPHAAQLLRLLTVTTAGQSLRRGIAEFDASAAWLFHRGCARFVSSRSGANCLVVIVGAVAVAAAFPPILLLILRGHYLTRVVVSYFSLCERRRWWNDRELRWAGSQNARREGHDD